MSQKKTYKHGKRGQPRFTMLYSWVTDSPAWHNLKPGPMALFFELRKRFNGTNNGEIFLSARDAAKALNVGKDAAQRYFKILEQHGFIRMTTAGHLGPSGVGRAAKWALEDEPLTNGTPAGKAFMRWSKNQNPVQKLRTPCHDSRDTTPSPP